MLRRYENRLNTISSAEYDQNLNEKNVNLQVCIEHVFVNMGCINLNLKSFIRTK